VAGLTFFLQLGYTAATINGAFVYYDLVSVSREATEGGCIQFPEIL